MELNGTAQISVVETRHLETATTVALGEGGARRVPLEPEGPDVSPNMDGRSMERENCLVNRLRRILSITFIRLVT